MRTDSAAWVVLASAGVAVRPVPIAQTGSYATSEAATCSGDEPAEPGPQLAQHDGLGFARFALAERFSHAEHRRQARAHDRLAFAPSLLVGFAENVPALRVADQHERRARGAGERCRSLAGERALVFPVHVLRPEPQVRTRPGCVACGSQRQSGRKKMTVRPVWRWDVRGERRDERRASTGPQIHLPVRRQHGPRPRRSRRHGASSSAATPGRFFPSRNSSDAPPPVDTWLICALESGLRDRGSGISAPDDRRRAMPRRGRHRPRDRECARVERRRFEHAHRPVPDHGLGGRNCSRVRLRRFVARCRYMASDGRDLIARHRVRERRPGPARVPRARRAGG